MVPPHLCLLFPKSAGWREISPVESWGRGSDSSLESKQVWLWLLGLCSCCQCWNVSVFWALGLKQLCLEGRGNALWIERDWVNANVSTEFNSTGLHCWSYGRKNALFTTTNTCNECFQACFQMPWNIPSYIHSTAAWSLKVAAKWSCNLCCKRVCKAGRVQSHFFQTLLRISRNIRISLLNAGIFFLHWINFIYFIWFLDKGEKKERVRKSRLYGIGGRALWCICYSAFCLSTMEEYYQGRPDVRNLSIHFSGHNTSISMSR